MTEQPDPKQGPVIRQAIADARTADATAQRLTEGYVHLLILANAGGLVACLGIADALAGGRDSSSLISYAALTGPMWFFLFGLIFGSLIVSMMRVRAVRDSEEHGQRALQALKDAGVIVPTLPSVFSRVERKGLPHLNRAINVLGIASPACFLVGAVWGLLRIGAVHYVGRAATVVSLGTDRFSGIIPTMGSVAIWVGDFISVGLLVAAMGALGTWRVRVLGGRKIELAERCLDSVRDFAVRIKVARMEQTNLDQQMEEIRNSLLELQRAFLRLNYYVTPPISEDIPNTLKRCFATLDTSFRELKSFEFREPKSPGSGSIVAAGAGAQEKQRYQAAHSTFYGLSGSDLVGADLIKAEGQLADTLRPILIPPAGFIDRVVGKISRWL
ncbi:hypothetical protein [Acidiphilium sp. C61]|uniref:hypothetical protein n=1 Tax=Acidiphilium sp. C61 TaxID=1671485 RepID=UPI00157A283C|nr:hypothetical protein [Acidiphilium sp. C61]